MISLGDPIILSTSVLWVSTQTRVLKTIKDLSSSVCPKSVGPYMDVTGCGWRRCFVGDTRPGPQEGHTRRGRCSRRGPLTIFTIKNSGWNLDDLDSDTPISGRSTQMCLGEPLRLCEDSTSWRTRLMYSIPPRRVCILPSICVSTSRL